MGDLSNPVTLKDTFDLAWSHQSVHVLTWKTEGGTPLTDDVVRNYAQQDLVRRVGTLLQVETDVRFHRAPSAPESNSFIASVW